MKHTKFVDLIVAGLIVCSGPVMAEGDATTGEKLYKGFLRCNNCHSLETGVTKVGPSLYGLFGRKAGTLEGFDRYSEAMINSGVTWDEASLDQFLKDPQKFIPGNTMIEGVSRVVGRVTSDQHRADLIAYLKKALMQ